MRRATARVSAGAIERNARRMKQAAGGADLCAVVKADGYGHGIATALRAARAGGARMLAVASAGEAAAVRAAGDTGPLLILGALAGSGEIREALAADAEVACWDPDFARMLPDNARVHVKLDTGLGRLGTRDPRLATEIAEGLARRGALAGLWTHFATADEPGDEFFGEQLMRFKDWVTPLREQHPTATVHAANSAATLRDSASHFDMVRSGVALYGLDPFGTDPATQQLEPALTLTSYVAALKLAQPGDSTGYGRRFVATEPTMVATVPIGYGDGVRRGLSDNCEVLIGGRRRALLGTVSMDNITVQGDGCALGDEVVLLGAQGTERVLAEEWARRLQTINYEVTCGISARVQREPDAA
ncbi:MAG TPA: alanine racemase [Baekduia sp.]|nr:alanine racemase [Baekduia sp.]